MLRAFPRYCFEENTQLSPSLTQKPGTTPTQYFRVKSVSSTVVAKHGKVKS